MAAGVGARHRIVETDLLPYEQGFARRGSGDLAHLPWVTSGPAQP